jgi:hypothetical protein
MKKLKFPDLCKMKKLKFPDLCKMKKLKARIYLSTTF